MDSSLCKCWFRFALYHRIITKEFIRQVAYSVISLITYSEIEVEGQYHFEETFCSFTIYRIGFRNKYLIDVWILLTRVWKVQTNFIISKISASSYLLIRKAKLSFELSSLTLLHAPITSYQVDQHLRSHHSVSKSRLDS